VKKSTEIIQLVLKSGQPFKYVFFNLILKSNSKEEFAEGLSAYFNAVMLGEQQPALKGIMTAQQAGLGLATYRYLRVLIDFLPDATHYFSPLVQTIAIITLIYASFSTIIQQDTKILVHAIPVREPNSMPELSQLLFVQH